MKNKTKFPYHECRKAEGVRSFAFGLFWKSLLTWQGHPFLVFPVLACEGTGRQHALAIAEFDKAIQMFEAMEGQKPKSLDELVKKGHLTKMPKVPYGMKFNYDPKTGKVEAVMAK
ncbi:MAG: hypothetical protein O3B25_02445 [Verrucomicrobia bacterium]|nr:hypothetical protein [Verrucomicrobiota bacterium]